MDNSIYYSIAVTLSLFAAVIISRLAANKRFKKLSKDESINRSELLKVLKGRMYGYSVVLAMVLVLVFVLKKQLGINILADPITYLAFGILTNVILGLIGYFGFLVTKFRLLR